MKSLAGMVGVAGVLLVSSSAGAEPLGKPGQLALSAERLFGFSTTTTTQKDKDSNVEVSDSVTGFGALSAYPAHPFNVPRLGIDYLPIEGLTVGGSISFMAYSLSRDIDGTEGDGGTMTIFGIFPRAGYAMMFNETLGIWPRGGISYFTQSTKTDVTDPLSGEKDTYKYSRSELALTLEAHLVITPVDHVGITLGPTLDIGLTGGDKNEFPNAPNTESDLSSMIFGIQAGLAAWF